MSSLRKCSFNQNYTPNCHIEEMVGDSVNRMLTAVNIAVNSVNRMEYNSGSNRASNFKIGLARSARPI